MSADFEIVPLRHSTRTDKPKRIPGTRPRSDCHGLDQEQCTDDARKAKGCAWIADKRGREYCRGPPGSVTGKLPPGTSVVARPAEGTESPCVPLQTAGQCQADKRCEWVEEDQPGGRRYCRAHWGTQTQRTQQLQAGSKSGQWGRGVPMTWTGKYRGSRAYSAAQKETWYHKDAPLDATGRKYCRCLVESAAGDLMRHGRLTRQPYAVCNSTLRRSRSSAEPGKTARELGSTMANLAIDGACTAYADFEQWPPELLYTYATMRLQTTKGRAAFEGAVPALDDFLDDPAAYREDLLRAVEDYKRAGQQDRQPRDHS